MPNVIKRSKHIESCIKSLGRCIAECRGAVSMCQLAKRISLPASNLMYIEKGVNAPTADVYEKLMSALQPDRTQRKEMDRLYMEIRKTPPPDVCRIIQENNSLIDVIRLLDNQKLTKTQSKQVAALLASFTVPEEEGAVIK